MRVQSVLYEDLYSLYIVNKRRLLQDFDLLLSELYFLRGQVEKDSCIQGTAKELVIRFFERFALIEELSKFLKLEAGNGNGQQ